MRTARAVEKKPVMPVEMIRAGFLASLVSLGLVVLYAVALKEQIFEASTMSVFTSVIKVISGFVAGFIASRKPMRRGWLWGLCGGAVYALMAYVIFSIIAGAFSFSVALLSDIGMCAAAGALAAMVGRMLK